MQGDVVRYLGAVVGRSVAEDVASQVWVEVVAGAGAFRGDSAAFRRWVLTTARRRALDHRRRWWQRSVVLRPPGAFELDQPFVDRGARRGRRRRDRADQAAPGRPGRGRPAPRPRWVQRRGGRRAHRADRPGRFASSSTAPCGGLRRSWSTRPAGKARCNAHGPGAFFLSMRAVRLDDETADRMLAGVIDPADAPPGYAAVTELLGTARSAAGVPVPATAVARRPGDRGLVEPASAKQAAARWHGSRRRRVPVLAAVAFCAMTGGAYAAGATGAGSSTVSAVLDHIGVGSLVGASSGDHAAATSRTAALSGEAPAQTTTGAAAACPRGRRPHGRREGRREGRQGSPDLDGGERRQEPRRRARERARRQPPDASDASHTPDATHAPTTRRIRAIPPSPRIRLIRRIPAAGTGTAGARRSPAADGVYLVVNVPPARSRIRRAPSPARRGPSGTRAPCRAGWPRGTAARAPSGR